MVNAVSRHRSPRASFIANAVVLILFVLWVVAYCPVYIWSTRLEFNLGNAHVRRSHCIVGIRYKSDREEETALSPYIRSATEGSHSNWVLVKRQGFLLWHLFGIERSLDLKFALVPRDITLLSETWQTAGADVQRMRTQANWYLTLLRNRKPIQADQYVWQVTKLPRGVRRAQKSQAEPSGAFRETEFSPLSAKPITETVVTRRDVLSYWDRITPARFSKLNAAVSDESLRAITEASSNQIDQWQIPQAYTSIAEYVELGKDLHEFKRANAATFWEAFQGKTVTVEGVHYCPCCLNAAIRAHESGHQGWAVRLDAYVAIALPEKSVCYTPGGTPVRMRGSSPFSTEPLVQAVGVVRGPLGIDRHRADNPALVADRYYVLSAE